jgi:hypothetical protein
MDPPPHQLPCNKVVDLRGLLQMHGPRHPLVEPAELYDRTDIWSMKRFGPRHLPARSPTPVIIGGTPRRRLRPIEPSTATPEARRLGHGVVICKEVTTTAVSGLKIGVPAPPWDAAHAAAGTTFPSFSRVSECRCNLAPERRSTGRRKTGGSPWCRSPDPNIWSVGRIRSDSAGLSDANRSGRVRPSPRPPSAAARRVLAAAWSTP